MLPNYNALMQHLQAEKQAAAVYEARQTEDLFDAVFASHTAKLAALDPEYAAILDGQAVKEANAQLDAAADAAFYQTLAEYGVQ